MLCLQVLNKDGNAVYSITTNETFTVTPEYIGAQLLLKLKKMAEKYLGIPVSKAVISVPAEFDGRQRNYTIKAANMAGERLLMVIFRHVGIFVFKKFIKFLTFIFL